MADVQFRYGLRVLWSGGAQMLGTEELQKTIDICTVALDNQVIGILDPKLFKQSMGQHCHGSYTRLLKALKNITNKEQFELSDVIEVGPRRLLMIDGFGDGSTIAVKKAFDDQLKPKKLPLPISWQMAPSYFLIKAWES
jgi:hypothetical protein